MLLSKFDISGRIVVDSDDELLIAVSEFLQDIGDGDGLSDAVKEAAWYRKNDFAREAIESFLFCTDIEESDIVQYVDITMQGLQAYKELFCDIESLPSYFRKKMYLETELSRLKSILGSELTEQYEKSVLLEIRSILFKRWALLMGKNFVIWKFGLKKLDTNSEAFMKTIAEEAFFFYKELTVNEKDVQFAEYTKIVNSLVKTLKDITSVSEDDREDIVADIKQALGIELAERDPRKKRAEDIGEVAHNAL